MSVSSMKNSVQQSPQAARGQGEPFVIKLTHKQALSLATLLPLRYSLQPMRKKKGPKSNKNLANSNRRTNLPLQTTPVTPPAHHPANTSSPISLITPQKTPPPTENPKIPARLNEDSASMQNYGSLKKKSEGGCGSEWQLQFLKECREFPLFVKAYGQVFGLLEQRTRSGQIGEAAFVQSILNVINDEKMRRSKRGTELSEQLKQVFSKYRNKAISIKKDQQTPPKVQLLQLPAKISEKKTIQPPPRKQSRSRTGSQSSEDLGVDFDLNQCQCSSPVTQFKDSQFVQAAYISRNLRKIPPAQALSVLSKYSISGIDVLKIKALSSKQLTDLLAEVRGLKRWHPQCISDTQGQREESVESSFEVQEE